MRTNRNEINMLSKDKNSEKWYIFGGFSGTAKYLTCRVSEHC